MSAVPVAVTAGAVPPVAAMMPLWLSTPPTEPCTAAAHIFGKPPPPEVKLIVQGPGVGFVPIAETPLFRLVSIVQVAPHPVTPVMAVAPLSCEFETMARMMSLVAAIFELKEQLEEVDVHLPVTANPPLLTTGTCCGDVQDACGAKRGASIKWVISLAIIWILSLVLQISC